MTILGLTLFCILYNILGLIIVGIIASYNDAIGKCTNADFLSPVWEYRNFKVNWFGAIVLATFFNILIPAVSIGYWFRKLCTIGRK